MALHLFVLGTGATVWRGNETDLRDGLVPALARALGHAPEPGWRPEVDDPLAALPRAWLHPSDAGRLAEMLEPVIHRVEPRWRTAASAVVNGLRHAAANDRPVVAR